MSTTSAAAIQTLRLRNITGKDQQLWLEPLGDCVTMAPDMLYEVTATNALEEIDLSSDGFTVYGWVTRVSKIENDGVAKIVWEISD